jgi:hypothetical protein
MTTPFEAPPIPKTPPAAPDTSDASDAPLEAPLADLDGGELLTGIRDGAWLDAQTFAPLRYAVPGLIPEGLTLLIGPPKAGKSWIILDVLLAVAAGGRALGKLPVGPERRVLYLALEDGDRRMQDRCRKLLESPDPNLLEPDAPIPARFHYLTRVESGRVLDIVEAFLRRYPDTALVVVDTLGKVMPPALQGESAYQRDYRIGTALKRVADDHDGLAVTVLHHDRKAVSEDFVDAVNGTNGLAGAADTILVFARKRQATDGVLKVTGRDLPEGEYALTIADGRWTLDGDTLAQAAECARERGERAAMSELSNEVLEFVRKHPDGIEAKQLVEKFGNNVYQYLKRHVDAGRLHKTKRGRYAPVPASEPSEVSEQDRSEAAS